LLADFIVQSAAAQTRPLLLRKQWLGPACGLVGVFTVPQDWAVARTARQGQPLKSDVDRWVGHRHIIHHAA
jgi:hypothetical protein